MEKEQERKFSEILKVLKISKKSKILDAGSGPGILNKFINCFSVDIDLKSLKKFDGKKVLGNIDYLPFKECFDYVFCIDVIHLIKNINELERVLRKNGKLIIGHFCNKYNNKEIFEKIKKIFNLKIEREFLILGEKELEAVIIYRKS
ncbi:MAG: class I SAM-dependent methyltransferase [Candidatus Aenigmarchaeota archaeon]|nr:class I SAM-dependent methyltransferase [Candidatus Aenigmarchaeota archaeon]